MRQPFTSVLKRHAHMLFDFQRSLPLLRAIARKTRPGDIVVDVGCGLGILSFAAAHIGAKRVYAIDVDSEALDFARWQAAQLGMGDKIVFLEDHSHNVDLLEKADVLIQETVGPLAFDENFLPTLLDARKRFLKPGGRIIPERLSLMGAPVGPGGKKLAPPTALITLETKRLPRKGLDIEKEWRFKTASPLKGILLWPHIVWAMGCTTDCSPDAPPTHWKQTLFPVLYSGGGRQGERHQGSALPSREANSKSLRSMTDAPPDFSEHPALPVRANGARHPVSRSVKFSLKIKPHPLDPLHYSETKCHMVPGTRCSFKKT